jgi:hypothetical protein
VTLRLAVHLWDRARKIQGKTKGGQKISTGQKISMTKKQLHGQKNNQKKSRPITEPNICAMARRGTQKELG